MLEDIYSQDFKKEINKAALLLARTRYLEQVKPFVKDSKERLSYADKEIQRIIVECSQSMDADESFVESNLRKIISEELTAASTEAVIDSPSESLSFGNKDKEVKEKGYGGGPPSPPLKFDPKGVNPEPDAVTDLSYTQGPVLEDELRNADVQHDLNDETFSGENKNNFSSVKEAAPPLGRPGGEPGEEDTYHNDVFNDPSLEPPLEEGLNDEAKTCPSCGGSDWQLAGDQDVHATCSNCGDSYSLDELQGDLGADDGFGHEHEHGIGQGGGQDYGSELSDEHFGSVLKVYNSLIKQGVEVPEELAETLRKSARYGIPKEHGGDSHENIEKMHSCVEKVMEEGHSKESAIKICKAQLFGTEKKSCFRCNCDIEDGSVCEKCGSELIKKANPYGNPPLPNEGIVSAVCPQCGMQMQPGQQACATCGWSANNLNSQNVQNMENAHPDSVLNNRMQWGQQPSVFGSTKESQLPGEMGDNAMPGPPQPQAPVQMPQEQPEKPIRVDEGLSSSPRQRFDDVISTLANTAAARQFSLPTEEEIAGISHMYGLDDYTVRQNLKVVANFGNIVSVNGEINGDDNTEGMEEVQVEGLGGKVGNHKAEVPLNMAIRKVAEDLGIEDDMVYSQLKESFGNQDLPNEYITPITGDHRFYLPLNVLGNDFSMNEPPELPSPDDTRQELQQQPAH